MSESSPRDPLSLALHHSLRVLEAARSVEGASGEAFRRRAKDFPSLMAEAGLIPALTFYLSKSSPEKVLDALELVSCEKLDGERLRELGEALKEELGKKEAAGYSLVAGLIIDAIDKLAALGLAQRGDDGCPGHSSGEELLAHVASKLLEIRGSAKPLELVTARTLEPYLLELKKLAEAFFKEK